MSGKYNSAILSVKCSLIILILFLNRDLGPGQQCCYGDDGNIITGNNGGTADLVAPTNFKTTLIHFLVDVVPWFLCCIGPFKDCSKYTSRRPVDDCSEWPERPPPGLFRNFPHYRRTPPISAS